MLNTEERRRTRDELRRNLELSGLDVTALADEVGMDEERVRSALAVDDADPVDVWRLRDHLERTVRDAGREPVAFTVLTPVARRSARGWFGID